MKRKIVAILLYCSLSLFSTTTFAASADIASIESQAEEIAESTVEVINEDLLAFATELDPDISLKESNRSLFINIDKAQNDTTKDIRRFFWDIVSFLKYEELSNLYDSISCTFLYGENIEVVNITDFNGFLDYTSTYIGPLSSDETVKSVFPQYYWAVFGSMDVSASLSETMYEFYSNMGSSYDLPDTYQSGFLWIFSNFDYTCGFSIDDQTINVRYVASDTVEAGVEGYVNVNSACNAFDDLVSQKPYATDYTKIHIEAIESSNTDNVLWDFCIEKVNGSWSVTSSTASGNYLTGINQAIQNK